MGLELKWVRKEWYYAQHGRPQTSKYHIGMIDTTKSYRSSRPQDNAVELETLCGAGLEFGYDHHWDERRDVKNVDADDVCKNCRTMIEPYAKFCFENAEPKWVWELSA